MALRWKQKTSSMCRLVKLRNVPLIRIICPVILFQHNQTVSLGGARVCIVYFYGTTKRAPRQRDHKRKLLSKLSRQVGDALAQAQVGGITGGAVDGVGETVVWAEVEMEVWEDITQRNHSRVQAGCRGAGGWIIGRPGSWKLVLSRSLERSRMDNVNKVTSERQNDLAASRERTRFILR